MGQGLDLAVGLGNLDILRIDAAHLPGITVCQVIQGGLGDIESIGGVIDGEDIDGLAIVGQTVARAALRYTFSK